MPVGSDLVAVYFGNSFMPTAVAARDRPPSDLYHEYGHHFMNQYMPMRFPLWFVEGFAEVISTASFEVDGHITYGKVADQRGYELEAGPWTPMARLFAEPGDDDEGTAGGHSGVASYGQYWVTTHYLLFAPERRGQLARYISAITRGEDSIAAAEAAFPGGLEQLDRDVRTYLRRANFQYRPVPLPEGVMRAPAIRTMRASEGAILRLEMEAARTWRTEDIDALLPRIAAMVAQYPQEPAAHALQAWMLARAERFEEALAAADRGIAADSSHARSHALRAYALMRNSMEGDKLDNAHMADIAASADRARELDPREPALALTNTATRPATRTTTVPIGSVRTIRITGLPPMEVTQEQQELIMRGYQNLSSNEAVARQAFADVAANYPQTDVGRFAAAMVAWLDGDRREPPPGSTRPASPSNPQ